MKERHINTRYKSSQEDWFSEPEHFTSVALIHQKKHKTRKDIIKFANMHLKGDFSECEKVTTNISALFAPVECTGRPYTLLIEGAPGIGKTILAREIVFRWANGTLLKTERLVFLIYLRDPKVQTISTFESFINYISYSQISKSIEQYVSSVSGKGVTLLFDGYDEFPEGLRDNSYLSNVISHEVFELQSCNIIITSRPSASACLHNNIDLRVEILGFTKEHRKSYIVHALKDNPNAIQDLLEYLECSHSVDAYCHVPLSMAILVFLFKESDYDKTELPTTQTAINYKFVCIIIRRFIKKFQKEPLTISKFSEVPNPYKQILLEISKLAFKALQEDKIVFSASEISGICPGLLQDSKHWNGLDLLKAVQYFNLEENADELSFNFLHFSVQELLAAYHISLMSTSQQIKLLKEMFWNSRYFNACIMYVALTKDQPFAFKHFLSGNRLQIFTRFSIWRSGNTYSKVSKKMKESKIRCLHLFQCFTEAGNDDMCHYVGNLLQDGIIDLSGQVLSAANLYTLSLFLARGVRRQWKLLDISKCYLDDENLEKFLKSYTSLTKSTVYINTINLSSNFFTKVSASQIANLIINFNVRNLIFASNEIRNIGVDQNTFAALKEYSNLVQSIKIQDDNQIIWLCYKKGFTTPVSSELFALYYCTVENFEDVVSFVNNNSSLFEMFLNTNSMSTLETTVHRLINKMTFLSTGFKLYVKNTNFATQNINSIISNLASNIPVTLCIGDNCLPLRLYISNDFDDENEVLNINSSGTVFFCGKISMQVMHSLLCSYIANNNLHQIYLNDIILYDHFIYISINCPALNTLQLVNCYTIDATVVNTLSQVIQQATFLKHLNLSSCRLKIEHMKIILEALGQATGIETIILNSNHLSYEICDNIAFIITGNKALQNIELSNCHLQETGIFSITKALESSKDLQLLDLSSNAITDEASVGVATILKYHSVKILRLQNCRLQYFGFQIITEAMIIKTCLECIDISSNFIHGQNVILFASVIENNKNLQKLNISNCKLRGTGCQQIFKSIAKIANLTHLDLSNNVFADGANDDFALMIHQNKNLEYLNISGCSSTVNDFEKITQSLISLKSLHHLDLSCNVINVTSAENIAVIITNNAYLEDLNISHCELHESALLKSIIVMKNNHHLNNLNFNSNLISCEEATKLALVVSNNLFLEKVDFSNCNLTEKEIKSVLSSLRNHTSLKHLDISSNTITNDVVNDIVDVIDGNTQLTYLNISDAEITEYGILKIFEVAQRIHTFKCIKMCNCTISNRAARAIADAISVNCMIEELVLTNNDFHEVGVAVLLGVLKESHFLKRMTLAFNNVISNVTAKVTAVVSNSCTTHLNLSNCGLQRSSSLSILNALMLQAPKLQHFDLSHNNLSGAAETVAQLISVSYYLQYVNLANTLMQDEEIMMIIKAMQNINSLHHVDLTSYAINDELALELQNTISENYEMYLFQVSKLCVENEFTIITLSEKNIFDIIINLQHLSVRFDKCKNDEVGAIATIFNNSPNLQYLHLENCSMHRLNLSSIIVTLARTTTLKYFCLINIVIADEVNNGIAAIIENNIQLKHFKLVACKVNIMDLTKCLQLFNMTRLSHLVLSKMDNVISHNTSQLKAPICDSLTHLNLSDVHLGVTKLSLLSLTSLTKLQYLDLSHNPISNEGADTLSAIIFNNKDLNHLNLCDCKLQSEGIKIITNSFQVAIITYLDISHNTVDNDTFNSNVMPALWSILKVIEHLCLPCCQLKQREIDNTAPFISNAVCLKFINFGSTVISKKMINDFKNIIFVSKGSKLICFNTEGIKKLKCNGNKTETLYHSLYYLNINNVVINDHVENIVIALLVNSPKLEHLEVAGCEWNCTMTKLLHQLSRYTSLRILNLNNCCRLEDTKTISIITEGTRLSYLNYLDLSNNSIGDEIVEYLAVLIATNVRLEYLNFCNSRLSSSGIHIIINTLKLLSFLKFLDIRFNNHESKGLFDDDDDIVSTLLSNNKHLEQLRLSCLVLDSNNFHQAMPHLLVIKVFEQLTIRNCFLTEKDTSRVISLIVNNPTIHKLGLYDCKMSMKSKIKFCNYIATAMYRQYLKFCTITISDKTSTVQNLVTSLHYTSKYNLTDNDVVAVMTVDHNLGELIMFKLILNQKSLKLLSNYTVTIKYLKILYIQDCTFTDYYAHYVASLLTNNATTMQSFSLTSCKMSIKQKTIINKALCKLNSTLILYLNIENICYIDKEKNETKLAKTNCKPTYDIITAVTTDENIPRLIRIPSLVIYQRTLMKLTKLLIKGLIYLNIKDCQFNNADVISQTITRNTGLVHFTLSECDINENRLVKIIQSIAESLKYLLHINFSHLKCSCEVVQYVMTVISCNVNLIHINLCNCQLSTVDVKHVLQAAKNLTHLEYFDLSQNHAIGYLANDITALIANNTNIKELRLPHYTLLIHNTNFDLNLNTVTDLLVNDIATILMATCKNVKKIYLLNCTLNNNQLQVIHNAMKEHCLLPCPKFIIKKISNEKSLKASMVQMVHHSDDQLKFGATDYLSIVGCTFDYKIWNINAMLTTLILIDCQLCGGISEIINNCVHLKCLDLTNVNTVESNEDWLLSFYHGTPIVSNFEINLTTFYLNCMNFTVQIAAEVMNIVYNSKNLNQFAMVKCDFDDDNDYGGLTKAFSECRNLLYVDLSYSKINHEMVAIILTHSKNLTHINIASCNIKFTKICNSLLHHFHIEHLNLNSNKNVGYYASNIASIIMNNNNLKYIGLGECYLNKDGIVEICKSAGLCSKLQHIDLSHNEVNVVAVINMLWSTEHLEYINLQKCGLKYAGSKDIIRLLSKFSSLRHVDLSLNEMAEDSCKHIATMITNNKVEVLCLPDIRTTYSMMTRHIFDPLKRVNSLKHVNFGSTQVNDDFASDIAALTANNSGLIKLHFSKLVLTHHNNKLKQLGNSMLIIEGLNSISITGVHFADSDADNLATLINNNKSVKSFDISNCVMSDKAKNIMFDTMINLTSLTLLNLKNIVLSGAVEDKFLVVITNNTQLVYLEVTGCKMNITTLNKVIYSYNDLKVVSE